MAIDSPPESARADLQAWRSASAKPYDGDPFFRRLLRRHMGASYSEHEVRLREVAATVADPRLEQSVFESSRDENLPRLRRHDPDGRASESVVFHPAYHEVGRAFWSSGVLAALAEPGRELVAGAIAYLLDRHGEAGHACPVACTAGAVKLLQRVGSPEQRDRYLPALLTDDYDLRLHAAQFVTEVQGGSDVGANAVTATPEADRPGWYRISGEKWFCSVADAGLFVVSARLEEAPPGTRGLGLFLVPRLIDGRVNGFQLRRLKSKLGTRSMATGEIEFDGALGEAIGATDQGFKNLVAIVLDTSRVHNAVAACAIMRRSLEEARAFAAHRLAFAQRIADYPSVQELLARMRLRSLCGLATTFRILAMSDRLEEVGADEGLVGARRISVMINKYWTALAATRTARDGIEILGGNGTIEDFSVLPRLWRDAIVVESWEGTHNTLCAQVLRDFSSRGLQRPWLEQLAGEIEALDHEGLAGPAARARTLHGELGSRIDRLLAADPVTAAAHVRHVVDSMCRLSDLVALASQAQWDLEQEGHGEVLDAVELYRLLEIEGSDPLQSSELLELNRRLAGQE